MGSSMRLTPWKRREAIRISIEEFARFLQEKETVTGDKCMALLKSKKGNPHPPEGNRRVGIFCCAPKSPQGASELLSKVGYSQRETS